MKRGLVFVVVFGMASCGSDTMAPEPTVVSVDFSVPTRIKVGEANAVAVSMALSDGSVGTRSVTWGVTGTGAGSVNGGALTATSPGTLQLSVTIDGFVWNGPSVDAYDWEIGTTDGFVAASIVSHEPVPNRFGTIGYARLSIGCITESSFFTVSVSTSHIVTANGVVAYGLDGAVSSGTWDESSDFRYLFHPSASAQRKAFASQLAGGNRLSFVFGEFNGGPVAVTFHLGGLASRLPAVLGACPINYLAPPEEEALLREMAS